MFNGISFLFTIIDRCTRWPEALPLTCSTASTCADALLLHWVSRFGAPCHITSDQGAQFTSSLWSSLPESLGAQIHRTSAYHPQVNELVERLHRDLKASLRAHLTGPN